MTHTARAILALLLVATPAYAQQAATTVPTASVEQGQPAPAERQTLREAARSVRFDVTSAAAGWRAAPSAAPRAAGLSRTKRGILAAVAGAGGFFGGGFLGAAIEGDRCDCDDPGLVGFIIGAPVGAATAAIVTWIWTR